MLLKQKLVEPQACFSSFWKLVMSMMYMSMYGYFSWHKIIIWSFKNQWFLNFNCVLLIIKLAEGFEFFLKTLGDTSSQTTHIFGEKVCNSILKQFNHFAWRLEVYPLNHFSFAKVKPLRQPNFLELLLDWPTVNFGPLSRGRSHSPNVSHWVLST